MSLTDSGRKCTLARCQECSGGWIFPGTPTRSSIGDSVLGLRPHEYFPSCYGSYTPTITDIVPPIILGPGFKVDHLTTVSGSKEAVGWNGSGASLPAQGVGFLGQ